VPVISNAAVQRKIQTLKEICSPAYISVGIDECKTALCHAIRAFSPEKGKIVPVLN
jgi:hypothetical protein